MFTNAPFRFECEIMVRTKNGVEGRCLGGSPFFGLFRHKCGSVECRALSIMYADAFGIRSFGEIRSGYDARAIGNSIAVFDSLFARGLRRNRISPRCPCRQFP